MLGWDCRFAQLLLAKKGMLEQIFRWLAILLIACFAFPGCAHFTKSGRQQLAYQKYVRKQSGMRAHRQAKMRKLRVPPALLSEPKTTTGPGDSPQSVSSAESRTSE